MRGAAPSLSTLEVSEESSKRTVTADEAHKTVRLMAGADGIDASAFVELCDYVGLSPEIGRNH